MAASSFPPIAGSAPFHPATTASGTPRFPRVSSIAKNASLGPPRSTWRRQVWSTAPLRPRRTSRPFCSVADSLVWPAISSRPSGSTTRSRPRSSSPATSSLTSPLAPKVLSNVPSALKRAAMRSTGLVGSLRP